MSVFSNDDITIKMLEGIKDGLHDWSERGEIDPISEGEVWIIDGMDKILSDNLCLLDALLALQKFSFVRYKPGGESFGLHPLVHYWAKEKLKSSSDDQSLKICSIGLIASNFDKHDRIPPIVPPYLKGDHILGRDEGSLRLWPWRQYLRLGPHASHCLRHIPYIEHMAEPTAFDCLSLLQVLEYTPFSRRSRASTADLIRMVAAHVVRFRKSRHNALDISVTLWCLFANMACHCDKAHGDDYRGCSACQSAYEEVEQHIAHIRSQRDRTYRPQE